VLKLTFARAFDLLDPKDPTKVNVAKFNTLAAEWERYMKDTPLDVDLVLKKIDETKKEIKDVVLRPPPQGGPGGAGGPGLPGGAGGVFRGGGFPGAGAGGGGPGGGGR